MSERTIENVREYNLDPKEVIVGLNGYYESDKCNGYITVRRNDVEGPAYFTPALYLSALIEWLRVDHDIFYYPGMDIRARYLSDKASVEYVFSLLDSYYKQRNEACIDRDRAVDDYKLKLKDYILHDIKKRGYRYDGLEKKSIEDIVDWIIEMATCNTRPYILAHLKETLQNRSISFDKKDEKDILKLIDLLALDRDKAWGLKQECYDYLWNALKELSPECDALKITDYEDLVDRIFYEMSLINDNCKRCQRKHSTEKFDYIRRANKAEEEVKKLDDVIKRLKELLNEINKKEDDVWFKP